MSGTDMYHHATFHTDRCHRHRCVCRIIIEDCARVTVLYCWSWLLTNTKHRAASLRQQSFLCR